MNETDPIKASPRSRAGLKNAWLFILIGMALLVLASIFLVGAWFFFLRPAHTTRMAHTANTVQVAQASKVIASFQADFQPEQPKPGWHYHWNADGPVGNPTSYVELRWNGGNYYVPTDPVPTSGRYLQLSNRSGHPGQGPAQNIRDDNEHAIVIAFTVAEAGRYAIRDSFILRNDGPMGGAVHLRVFVNDREIASDLYCRTREKTSFDRELGNLAARDSIYVCIGPGESDYHDSFAVDFSIGHF